MCQSVLEEFVMDVLAVGNEHRTTADQSTYSHRRLTTSIAATSGGW